MLCKLGIWKTVALRDYWEILMIRGLQTLAITGFGKAILPTFQTSPFSDPALTLPGNLMHEHPCSVCRDLVGDHAALVGGVVDSWDALFHCSESRSTSFKARSTEAPSSWHPATILQCFLLRLRLPEGSRPSRLQATWTGGSPCFSLALGVPGARNHWVSVSWLW